MRSSVIETLGEDYVTTARAKGLTDTRILRAHALPNALLPAVTLVAINLGYVVAGAITVEIVFNWPGLGTLTVDALAARDYPVLQGASCSCRSRSSSPTSSPTSCTASSTRGSGHEPRRRRAAGARPREPGGCGSARATFWRQFSRSRPAWSGSSSWSSSRSWPSRPALFVGPLQTVTTATGAQLEPPSLDVSRWAPMRSAGASST